MHGRDLAQLLEQGFEEPLRREIPGLLSGAQ
jgi:hypothetical protein